MVFQFDYNKEHAELSFKLFGAIGAFLAAWTGTYFTVDAIKTQVTNRAQTFAVWAVPATMLLPAMMFMVFVDQDGFTISNVIRAVAVGIAPVILLYSATACRVFLVKSNTHTPLNEKFWALLIAIFGFEFLFWQQALDLFTTLFGRPH